MIGTKGDIYFSDVTDAGSVTEDGLPGIIVTLGDLKPGTIVTEEGISQLFKRHIVSVKRAVDRGELPPPCRLFGSNVWTAGVLIRHIEGRLEKAARETKLAGQRVAKHLL